MQRALSGRNGLLTAIATEIFALASSGVVRVAVDGVDGAGKTVFADELGQVLGGRGVSVIRASVDGFHQPREIRYRRGRGSPEGYFLDSYDYDALRKRLLDPLGPGGDRRYIIAVYDVSREQPVNLAPEVAVEPSVLVLDGIFLHRPELLGVWDYSIFLDVPFEVSVPRGAQRGAGYGDPDPGAESNRRYVEGQKHYLERCQPQHHATVVIDNTDLAAPGVWRRNAAPPGVNAREIGV